jgi:hypothetical protein
MLIVRAQTVREITTPSRFELTMASGERIFVPAGDVAAKATLKLRDAAAQRKIAIDSQLIYVLRLKAPNRVSCG